MTFEELLAEFRALGGVAENVRMGEGRFGRGVFVVDPSKPAKLHCPENVLVPVEELERRDGQLVAKIDGTLGARERAFFDAVQRYFGWGAGAYDELRRVQTHWSQLPDAVVDAIRNMGAPEDLDIRFLPASLELCAQWYVRSRQVTYHDRIFMMPLIDLINHSSSAGAYAMEAGIGVEGRFEDELVVRYNLADSWKRAIGHGFADRSLLAHSVALALDIDEKHVTIGRTFRSFDIRDGVMFPRASIDGNTIDIPYLSLGNVNAPDVPRAVFRSIVSPYFTVARADDVFDNIAHFNRTKFLSLLRTLEGAGGPIAALLREAAINQLETLSCCIGARSL